MNRRRFVPGTEAFEGRTLMASSGINNLFGIQLNTNLNVPITYQQKALRINHLPYYLEKISPGRFLPKPELKDIQATLFDIMDGIHKPTQLALNYYNTQLRSVVPKQSINATMIDRLDHAFGVVLTAAQTPPNQITNLKVPLFKLTSQVDTASIMPVVLASNDWTLVLETALAVGRPMPPPSLARIKRNQGLQAGASTSRPPCTTRRWSAATISTPPWRRSCPILARSWARESCGRTTPTTSTSRPICRRACTRCSSRPSTRWGISAGRAGRS